MDRSRIHSKISGPKQIFRAEVMLCSYEQFGDFIRLLHIFAVWFSVRVSSTPNGRKAWDEFTVLKQMFKQGCVETELVSLETN